MSEQVPGAEQPATAPDLDAAAVHPGYAPDTTGDPRVDAAVARLEELDDAPTADHVAVFEDVHARLHDALADLEPTG